MSRYVVGILLAFAAPLAHAWANIIDSTFSNKVFDRLTTVVLFSELVNLALLPLIIIVDPPTPLHGIVIWVVVFVALIEVLYQYPYYWAFRHTDTSIVTSLFSLGKIFIPLFAFLLVKEQLGLNQYIGFFVIVISSVCLIDHRII